MMKVENKGIKLFTSKEEEIIEKIVKEDHVFRKLNKIIDFEKLIFPYSLSEKRAKYGIYPLGFYFKQPRNLDKAKLLTA